MLTAIIQRGISVLLAACGVFGGAGQAAAPPAPSARQPFAPFGLMYLPRAGEQGIIAFRPAEIARHFPAHPLNGQARLLLGMCLSQSSDCDWEAATPPRLAEIDECVCGLRLKVTFPTAGAEGSFMCGVGTPLTLRTVKPFDWTAAVRKWFPRVVQSRHAGRTYFRTAWKLDSLLIPPDVKKRAEGQFLGILVPDDRTLVFGDEQEIKKLLDRLKEGSAVPEPPGWQEVHRDLIAGALDQREAPWVQGEWPKEPPETKDARILIETIQVAAFGVMMDGPGGKSVAGRLVATTRETSTAIQAKQSFEGLVVALRTALDKRSKEAAPEPVRMIHRALDEGRLSQKGRTFRARIEVPLQLLQLIVAAWAADSAAEAAPSLLPPPVEPGHSFPGLRSSPPSPLPPISPPVPRPGY